MKKTWDKNKGEKFRNSSKFAANGEFSISAQLHIPSCVHFCQQKFNEFLLYQVSSKNVCLNTMEKYACPEAT